MNFWLSLILENIKVILLFPILFVELLGSVDNITTIITKLIKIHTFSYMPIYVYFLVEFSRSKFYSPWIFNSPNPTLRPVSVNTHITPATVKISLVIAYYLILLLIIKSVYLII